MKKIFFFLSLFVPLTVPNPGVPEDCRLYSKIFVISDPPGAHIYFDFSNGFSNQYFGDADIEKPVSADVTFSCDGETSQTITARFPGYKTEIIEQSLSGHQSALEAESNPQTVLIMLKLKERN